MGKTHVLLEAEHPEMYRRFTISTYVVRDRMGSFNSFELYMKLESPPSGHQRAREASSRPDTEVASGGGVGADRP